MVSGIRRYVIMADPYRAFFDHYEAAYNPPNLKAIAAAYAENFMMSSPEGTGANHNGPQFLEGLQRVSNFYRKLGVTALRIADYEEMALDAQHALVQVTWSARGENGQEIVAFDMSYVVGQPKGQPAILMFISHNETERLKQKGLMAE
jgi:hypothetical protein